MPRVTSHGPELVSLPNRPDGDERSSLLLAPIARVHPPFGIGLPRMDDAGGRPPVFARVKPHRGHARTAHSGTQPSSTATVAAATVCPGAVGGPPSFSGAPGRVLEGLSEPARPSHPQHPHPSTSSQAHACVASPSRAGPSNPASPSPPSSAESGAQTARTNQSTPSLHSTEDLLWIEDAMKEAWCRSRAATEAASRPPERALTGLTA